VESGLKKMNHVSHARFYGRRVICIFIIGAVFIAPVGVAIADVSSRTAIARLQPAIEAETTFGRIPVSTLNLTLTGVVRGKISMAVISVEGARDKLFTVGGAITPNVKLLAVDAFGAVISHNGVPERLEFSRKTNASGAAIIYSQEPVPSLPPLKDRTLNPIPAEAVQDMGNSRFIVKRSLVNDQVQTGDLFTHAKIASDSSGIFRVIEITPGSLYDTLGLKDGDAISAINGKSLKSVAELTSLLYEQRDSIKSMQIQVTRDGDLNNLQLDFQ
jgi:type II secretory pathway component PulC